ncbi:hypothetical protein HK096_003195 [Nowakowskiella sp. JEL0078]|nr:hypothetical protein HK096_003195 [Nowakowskiella sp. JEL0078]
MSWSLVSSTIQDAKPSDPKTPVKILNVTLSENVLSGNVKIAPIGLHRVVAIHHSTDGWATIPEDIVASFVGATGYGAVSDTSEDSYIFNINLDNTFSSQIKNTTSTYGAPEPVIFTLVLAVKYESDNEIYWDNNNLRNYEITLNYKPKPIVPTAGTSSRAIIETVTVTSTEAYTVTVPKAIEIKPVLRPKLFIGSIQLIFALLFFISTIALTLVTVESIVFVIAKSGAWIFTLLLFFAAIANISYRLVTVTTGSEEYAPLLGGPTVVEAPKSFLTSAYDIVFNRLLFPSAIQFEGAVASWTVVFIRRVWQSLSIVYSIFQVALSIYIIVVHHSKSTTPDDNPDKKHHFTLLTGLAVPAYIVGVILILSLPFLIISILVSAPWVSRQSKWISVAASSPPAYVAVALYFVFSTIYIAFVPQPANHPSYSEYVLPFVLVAGPFLLALSLLVAIAAITKQIGGLPQAGVVAPKIFDGKFDVSKLILVDSILVIVIVIIVDTILLL